ILRDARSGGPRVTLAPTTRGDLHMTRRVAVRIRLLAAVALAACSLVAVAGEPSAPRSYALTADSLSQPGAPQGRLEGPFEFHSRIIPGTVRRYWVHVPAAYDPATPANLLVFHDGH